MNIRPYFEARRGAMIDMLEGLVRRESPTHDKKAVDACSRLFLGRLAGLPRDILRIPQAGIGDLYAIGFPGLSRSADKPILVLTHVDTVWPVGRLKDMPWRVAGPRAYGPGALDMKAGLVMALFAFRAVRDLGLKPRRPAVLFINSAEETGHPAASRWIEQLARSAACVLCLEPALPGGALKVRRKGRLVVELAVRGRAAHAGTPRNGVNAIEELMTQLRALRSLESGSTSLNIGLVSGGTKANVVPDAARAVLDFRFWRRATERKIRAALGALRPRLPGAGVSCSVESSVPPMERNRASRHLFDRAAGIALGLGLELEGGPTGGGSDASLAASLGLPTLDGLGPDGDGIHGAKEHVLIPSLLDRTALLTALLTSL
jgi:glutamate carboxypeptidase